MQQETVGDYEVHFEPKAFLATLDYKDAIDALNKSQEAQNVEWVKAGAKKETTKPQFGLVDVIYGSFTKDSQYADFVVNKMYQDKKMEITVFNTPGGRKIGHLLDNGSEGFRITADVTEVVDVKVGFWTKVKCQLLRRPYPAAKKASGFSRFYLVVDKPVEPQPSQPVSSSIILLS